MKSQDVWKISMKSHPAWETALKGVRMINDADKGMPQWTRIFLQGKRKVKRLRVGVLCRLEMLFVRYLNPWRYLCAFLGCLAKGTYFIPLHICGGIHLLLYLFPQLRGIAEMSLPDWGKTNRPFTQFLSPDFLLLNLNANGLKSQHNFQCQTSTEVSFIIVFPSLIFSKCHHPSINEAFLVLSPHCRMRRYSVLVPVQISTRPLGYWAICIADPLTTLFLFLHTQTAWDGVWVLYALRPPEASFYLLPTSFALCPSDNPSRPERTGEVWRCRRWIEVTTAVQPLWRVLLLVDNQLSLNIPLWCILFGYFQRFLMAPVGLAMQPSCFHVPAEFKWHLLLLC